MRDETAIWKTKSENYKNKMEKTRSWNNLPAKYQQTDKSAALETRKKKYIYNGLRSLYRRELQKVRKSEKSGANADDIYVPTLCYFDNMISKIIVNNIRYKLYY